MMPTLHAKILTLSQALQLVGLVPCLFVALFLLTLLKRNVQVLIPIGYFLALACAFALPLVDIYSPLARNTIIQNGLLLGESTNVAFGFLLICQFLTGRVPPWPYWLVLAIPLIGGSSLTYASTLEANDLCFAKQMCLDPGSLKTLYYVVSSSLVFLLLVLHFPRLHAAGSGDTARAHKYWLIIALIMLHLLVLAADLALLSGVIKPLQAELIVGVFRLAFIYLVMTSLFRVFYPDMGGRIVQMIVTKKPYDPAAEQPFVDKVKQLLDVDHVYRGMNLNRARLAALVGISEYHLSRVINHHFGKSFHELINSYRVEEAKRRLQNDAAQITTIGFEAGFNSIASFNRVFKVKTGMSPTEFRAKYGSASAVTASQSVTEVPLPSGSVPNPSM